MPRALIAGCGDLGTRAGCLLAERGWQVSGLRRSGQLPAPLRTIRADLTDPASLSAIDFDPDLLLYLPTPDTRDEASYQQIFVDAPRHLLQALARTPPRVIFVSSTAVYGDLGGAWADEDSPPQPLGFNGKILLDAERALAAPPVSAVIVRLAGIYGPGREGLLRRVRAGAACREDVWTNRIHVVDAARALVHVATLPDPAPCYLGVDHEPASECAVIRWLAGHLGLPPPPVDVTPTASNGGRKRLRNRRLCETGFTFSFPSYRDGYAQLTAARAG